MDESQYIKQLETDNEALREKLELVQEQLEKAQQTIKSHLKEIYALNPHKQLEDSFKKIFY